MSADECNSVLQSLNFDFKIKKRQCEIIQSVLQGNDTFAVLPTGYGKSICYVLPPLILDKREPSKRHTSLVISPLKALIKDQVESLRRHGVAAYGIYEGMDENDKDAIRSGTASVLLASPESAITRYWKAVFTDTYKDALCVVTYDEVHCVSEWGLDFRPDYRKVTVLQSIMESPVLALTATATTDILADVKNTLCLNDVKVLSVLPDRPNTFICVISSSEKFEQELDWIKDGLENYGRSLNKIVVYVNSIAMCERLYIWLCTTLKDKAYDGLKAPERRLVEMYHAHTDTTSKERIMSDIVKADGTIRVLIATVAVGMGIDIPDITLVIMWGLPPSVLQMWQEAGRCGRDGRECIAITYAYPRSIALPCNNCRIQGKKLCSCKSRLHLKELVSTTECQRIHILKHFAVSAEDSKTLSELNHDLLCCEKCDDICRCNLCKCCIVCMQKCKCEKHNDSLKKQLLFYVK